MKKITNVDGLIGKTITNAKFCVVDEILYIRAGDLYLLIGIDDAHWKDAELVIPDMNINDLDPSDKLRLNLIEEGEYQSLLDEEGFLFDKKELDELSELIDKVNPSALKDILESKGLV